MTFLEDLQRSEARAEQLQQQLEAKTGQYEAAVADAAGLRQEIGTLNDKLNEKQAESEANKRLIGELRSQVAHVLLLEQELNETKSSLRDLNADHGALRGSHSEVSAALAETAQNLRDAKEQLSAVLSENEKARRLLEAFNAKAEAEKVIAGA